MLEPAAEELATALHTLISSLLCALEGSAGECIPSAPAGEGNPKNSQSVEY